MDKDDTKYRQMTILELKKKCENQGIKCTGTKEKIVNSLMFHNNTFEIYDPDLPTYVPQLSMLYQGNKWNVYNREKHRKENFSWNVVDPKNLKEYINNWKKEKEAKIKLMKE